MVAVTSVTSTNLRPLDNLRNIAMITMSGASAIAIHITTASLVILPSLSTITLHIATTSHLVMPTMLSPVSLSVLSLARVPLLILFFLLTFGMRLRFRF